MKILTPEVVKDLPSYNETEIRFRIIDPILRHLGYADGKEVYLKLEEKLEYPYHHIGRKNKKKDVPLGFPDYRAGLKGGRGSFIVEAKASNASICGGAVEQAHSYAAHAQVGANYFALCNGSNFRVYETLSGPESTPLIDLPLAEIDARFFEIENVLSPERLAKNCQITHDLKLRLCQGLTSSENISSGSYDMVGWAYRMFINGNDMTEHLKTTVPQIAALDDQLAMMQREFELRVSDGVVERDENGRISAHIGFSGVTKNSLATMKLLGMERMTFSTNEKFLSSNPQNPTVFESTSDFSLSKGTMISPLFGNAVASETDMIGDFFITARMYKVGNTVEGEYVALSDYYVDLMGAGVLKTEMDLAGKFSLNLAL